MLKWCEKIRYSFHTNLRHSQVIAPDFVEEMANSSDTRPTERRVYDKLLKRPIDFFIGKWYRFGTIRLHSSILDIETL